MKIKIQFKSIQDVKKYISLTDNIDENIDILDGHYIIDGKSIMGIFSLDLSKPLYIEINTTEDRFKNICEILKEFIVL